MGVLYKLTSPSSKSYVGITLKTLEKRWSKHVEHAMGKRSNGALYAAMRKYGADSFQREVLAESDDWAELCRMEIDAIRDLKTRAPNGYNLTDGGEGVQGERPPEWNEAVSRAQKKRFRCPKERERLRQAGIKGTNSPQAKESAKRRRKPPRRKLTKDEHAARVREAMKRTEVREKVLAKAKERVENTEWRAKISRSKKGQKMPPRTEEWRSMVREMRKREWADPAIRAKRLDMLAKARERKKQLSRG